MERRRIEVVEIVYLMKSTGVLFFNENSTCIITVLTSEKTVLLYMPTIDHRTPRYPAITNPINATKVVNTM